LGFKILNFGNWNIPDTASACLFLLYNGENAEVL